MPVSTQPASAWTRIPVAVRAVAVGFVLGMAAANVWSALLRTSGALIAACLEILFLWIYVAWAAGGGPPRRLRGIRADCFRVGKLSARKWFWGSIAALSFAAVVHASIVLLFRFVPFPAASFHNGYDLSLIHSRSLQWLVCVVSALSAGVCEETGFRGYMQRPIELRHGPAIAILISSLFFTLVHLTKDWALIGMVPIVFAAGVLLGALAHASGTLVFCMIGHTVMDVGLFAYWWTQIAGTFAQRPISASGIDPAFFIEGAAFLLLLAVTLASIVQLRKLRDSA